MIKDLIPAGHRILVKAEKVEEVTKGGIVIAYEDATTKKRKEQAQDIGEIVKIGPNAWDIHDKPWAKVGDKVMFASHAGIPVEIGGEQHRIMNDEDVTAIVIQGDE